MPCRDLRFVSKGANHIKRLTKKSKTLKLKEAHSFSYLSKEAASNCVFSHMFLTLQKENKQKNHPTNHYQNTTTPNYCYFPEILIDLLFFKEIHYSSEVCHAVFSFHVHEHTVRG